MGDVTVDPGARIVICRGLPVDLTTAEFDVLQLLVGDLGKIVSRDRLAKVLGRNLGVFQPYSDR